MNPNQPATRIPRAFVVLLGIMLYGCTGEESAGHGELALSVSGGAAVREGFPYQEGDTTFAFADGWTLQFTKYIVTVGNINLVNPSTGELTGQWDALAVMDLKKSTSGSVDLTTLRDLSAVRHDLSFDLRAVGGAVDNRNVDSADVALMQESGWSLLGEGTASHATKGAVRFRLGLPLQAHYYSCINGKDKTQGIAVEANKVTGAYIYAHAMHMFWDTLATGDEDLRFDAFAAMKGADDLVTEEELKSQDLNDLRDETGAPLRDEAGKSIFYNDNGKLPPGQQTLYHFVLEAARASAHFNGVGLCKQQNLGAQ